MINECPAKKFAYNSAELFFPPQITGLRKCVEILWKSTEISFQKTFPYNSVELYGKFLVSWLKAYLPFIFLPHGEVLYAEYPIDLIPITVDSGEERLVDLPILRVLIGQDDKVRGRERDRVHRRPAHRQLTAVKMFCQRHHLTVGKITLIIVSVRNCKVTPMESYPPGFSRASMVHNGKMCVSVINVVLASSMSC